MKKSRQVGFTLLELLVVVTIIGTITTIAAINYAGYVQRAKIAEAMRYAKSMQSSYAQYYVQTGAAPASLANLNLSSISTASITSTAYNAGPNQLQVNINVSALDVALGAAGCTLYFLFNPTVSGDVLTWGCSHGSNNVTASCTALVARVLPAECT